MFAIFPRAYAVEYTLFDVENPSSGAAVSGLTEADKTSMVLAALLGVSISGNVLSAIYICKRNKNENISQIDDVPLVEYDIDDDIV